MKTDSPHIQDKLLEFAYGEMPPADAQAVSAHLQGCPACTEALQSIQGVRRVMARLPQQAAPDAGLESLMGYAQQAARRAAAGPAPVRPRWWLWLAPSVGLAAMFAIAVVVTKGVGRSPMLEQSPQSAAKAPEAAPPPPVATALPSADGEEADKAVGAYGAGFKEEKAKRRVVATAPSDTLKKLSVGKGGAAKNDFARDDSDGVFAAPAAQPAQPSVVFNGSHGAEPERRAAREEAEPPEVALDEKGAVHAKSAGGPRGAAPSGLMGQTQGTHNLGGLGDLSGAGTSGVAPKQVAQSEAAPAAAPAPPARVASHERRSEAQKPVSMRAAQDAPASDEEILAQAVAALPRGTDQAELLGRLCELQEREGKVPDACMRLEREYPNHKVTIARRQRRQQGPAAAGASKDVAK